MRQAADKLFLLLGNRLLSLFDLPLRLRQIVYRFGKLGQFVVSFHRNHMIFLPFLQCIDSFENIADVGKPLAQQKQKEDHKEADGNQQAQIEYPIISLYVLSFRQNNILHKQDTVNDGTGCYTEKLKQEQGDDKGNCQYAQNLSG